jgi:hypothetical protein
MKIQGRLDLIQSNLDFYCRLTSTSSYRSVEDLRKFFYSRFLDDARRNLKSIVSSKEKVVDKIEDNSNSNASEFLKAVKSNSLVEENNDSVEDVGNSNASAFLKAVKEQRCTTDSGDNNCSNYPSSQSVKDKDVETVKGTILDDIDYDSASEETFLSAVESMGATEGVKPARGICLDDIVAGMVVQKEDVHGMYLEDIPSDVKSIKSTNKGIEEDVYLGDVHGTYLEDVKTYVEPVNDIVQPSVVKEDIHGVFLEDVKAEEPRVSDVVYEPAIETIVPEEKPYSIPAETIVSSSEENISKPVNSNIIPINEKVVVEVSVPATVREFLKKHPGSEVSEVEKYYPRKVIMKELKMGKIYKKGNKLFI